MLPAEAFEEPDVARERPAGKRRSRRQVAARADARLGLQSPLDLFRVRADRFAEPRHLVDEGHRGRQKRVERVPASSRRIR